MKTLSKDVLTYISGANTLNSSYCQVEFQICDADSWTPSCKPYQYLDYGPCDEVLEKMNAGEYKAAVKKYYDPWSVVHGHVYIVQPTPNEWFF